MTEMAMEVPRNAKTAPRAAVSHLARDLDEQARLAVEGLYGKVVKLPDPEAVQCTQRVMMMEGAYGG